MLFLFAKFRALLVAKIQALFYLQKNFGKLFGSNEGNRKLPIMGVLEDWDFLKKKFFCLCFICFVYVYSEENKKVAIMGVKEGSEPIWGKFFFCLGEYVKRLDLTK